MPRSSKPRKETTVLKGLIIPPGGGSLRALWRAFETGTTWSRIGKRSVRVIRLRHKAYQGKVTLRRWGPAIEYVIEDTESSGMIGGAFLGHVQRHSRHLIDHLELRFG